jgi:hypothetical protein
VVVLGPIFFSKKLVSAQHRTSLILKNKMSKVGSTFNFIIFSGSPQNIFGAFTKTGPNGGFSKSQLVFDTVGHS